MLILSFFKYTYKWRVVVTQHFKFKGGHCLWLRPSTCLFSTSCFTFWAVNKTTRSSCWLPNTLRFNSMSCWTTLVIGNEDYSLGLTTLATGIYQGCSALLWLRPVLNTACLPCTQWNAAYASYICTNRWHYVYRVHGYIIFFLKQMLLADSRADSNRATCTRSWMILAFRATK